LDTRKVNLRLYTAGGQLAVKYRRLSYL
jgi:hypothetical protein